MATLVQPFYRKVDLAIVSIFATISVTLCCSFFIYVGVLLVRHYSDVMGVKALARWARSRSRPMSESARRPRSTGLQYLSTQFGIIFCSMVLADLLQACGFVLSFHWLAIRKPPAERIFNRVCYAQGVLIAAGDDASAISSVLIAIHTVLLIVVRRKPPKWAVAVSVGFTWLAVILLGIAGPLWVETVEKGPFYSWTGVWCFIAPAYDSYRLYFHYLALLIGCAANILAYGAVYFSIRMHDRKTASVLHRVSETGQVAKKMLLFPLAYCVVVIPITSYRLAGMTGHVGPKSVLTFCGCLLTLSGTVNLVLYSYARKVVCISSLPGRSGLDSTKVYTTPARPSMVARDSFFVHLKRKAAGSSSITSTMGVFSLDLAADVVNKGASHTNTFVANDGEQPSAKTLT